MSTTPFPEVLALDVDQTLYQTNLYFESVVEACESFGLMRADDLWVARRAIEASGGSFDFMGHLSSAGVPEAELQNLATALGDNKEGKNYLFPDAAELLEVIDTYQYPHFVLTWGAFLTQFPKLRSAKLDQRPYLITDVKEKGILISQNVEENGNFAFQMTSGEMLVTRTVHLADDKAKSFTGLPANCTGTLVQRGAPKPSQLGEVPVHVTRASSLRPLTEAILTRVAARA